MAVFASDPARSRGRHFQTDKSPTRTPFQRDRDRILHSTAFRRLQHKTQVFLQHEGSHFRTRLTHTLEVSQIARALARALGLNEDLAEAIALAHDLGHPPFGHAGERVLDHHMEAFGGFDHNMQALRVVTEIENRYAEHDGLNLSWECLEGILKHNGPLTAADGTPLDQFAETGLPFGAEAFSAAYDLPLSGFASLEAQAAAIADDIAYNAHDLDDAVRAGLLSLDALDGVPLAGPIAAEVTARWPGLAANRQTHEVQRRLITRMVEDVIAQTRANLDRVKPASADAARAAAERLIGFSPDMAEAVRGLQKFLFAKVYRSETVMRPVRQGEAVVAALFERLLADPAKLPGRWRGRAFDAENDVVQARTVCDFVAGMTDPFALELYAVLFDARPDFG